MEMKAQHPDNEAKYLTVGILGLYPKIDREFYHKFIFMCQNLEEASYTVNEHGFTQTGILQFDFLDKSLVLRANFRNEVGHIRDYLLPYINGVIVHLPDQIIYETLVEHFTSVIPHLKELVDIILVSNCPAIFTSTIPFDITPDEQISIHRQAFKIPDSRPIIPYEQVNYETWYNLLSQVVAEIDKHIGKDTVV
jgi:hypothetical protein